MITSKVIYNGRGEEEEVIEPEEEVEGLNIEAKPRKHLPPLLVSLADKKMDRLHV